MSFNGICIFGGSFDPVHKGHKKLALFIAEKLKLHKMLIIPAGLSPFKKSTGADENQRLSMCRAAFSEDIFEISDIEIKRGGKSYTVDTVEAVKRLYPDEKLYLLIGSDQLLSFDRWYRYRDILSMVTLVSVSREKTVETEELKSFADEKLRPFGECIIFDFEAFEISSTLLRERISSGEDVSEYLDSEVSAYIQKEGLYKHE